MTTSWVRARAEACETASGIIHRTIPLAQDACQDLAKSAPGWSFVQSIDDMQRRWETLNKVITDRLDRAADNFRRSADTYDEVDIQTAFNVSNVLR